MIPILQTIFLQMTFWASGSVFSHPMEKREHFWKRMAFFLIVAIVETALLSFLLGDNIWRNQWAIMISSVIMVWILYSCWEISLSVAIYNSVWAISLWQILTEIWKVSRIVFSEIFCQNITSELLLIIVLFGSTYVVCTFTIAEWIQKDRKKRIGPRQLLSAIMIFGIIEIIAYTPAMRSLDTYSENWKFLYLSQMMCLVILYLQNELFKKSDMKQELAIMNLLWKKEQEQYKLTKENIALINQKSHDLKHHIRALRKAGKDEFEKYLDEMEDTVLIYEAIVKTGNEVFDTILTEKSLYCKDRRIQVSCVADGSQMDFINTVDLYSLLGNAMDNAIEAVEKFEEVEKRQIDVMIYRQQNFLVINIINPLLESLVYGNDEDRIPVTTKEEKGFHGFGLRSMCHIVKKYDGFLNISEEDGCFSLKILIPIPNEK